MAGVYDTPAIHLAVKCVFTNTAPIGPYRGAGRPEASYIIERIVDQAAAELGVDRIDLRRRNLIRPAAMPYRTPVTQTYDSGAFEEILDEALVLADWDGFAARREESRRLGRHRGIGVACFIEHAGARLAETARLRFGADGVVTVYSAAQSQGQGHFTSFAQVIAERLGIGFTEVRIVEGDSDIVPSGGQTTGSRSMAVCGGAMMAACDKAIETGKAIAAHLLEASVRDVAYESGRFRIVGTDRALTLQAVAAGAGVGDWPTDVPKTMDTDLDYEADAPTFPNGCHVCEVEIDPETGAVTLQRYAGVDDVGRVINRMIVDGQMHGGVAQGAGQALGEHCIYDTGSGQLLSGSFMDYALPRAADLPSFAFAYHPVPCRTNALGVKGAGESGTIGAIPAVANAIMDALRQAGVNAFDMPATPHRVWRLLHRASG
jgi:carbon-monoxide dehydrogenase large subunit